jgi:hypothetical protein
MLLAQDLHLQMLTTTEQMLLNECFNGSAEQ